MNGYEKRRQALALRVYKLRREGYTVGAVAQACGVERAKVRAWQLLGERLSQLTDGTGKGP